MSLPGSLLKPIHVELTHRCAWCNPTGSQTGLIQMQMLQGEGAAARDPARLPLDRHQFP